MKERDRERFIEEHDMSGQKFGPFDYCVFRFDVYSPVMTLNTEERVRRIHKQLKKVEKFFFSQTKVTKTKDNVQVQGKITKGKNKYDKIRRINKKSKKFTFESIK